MGPKPNQDFSSLLDDLFNEPVLVAEDAEAAPPPISFDYLSVADELHSGRINVSDDAAELEYLVTNDLYRAEFEAIMGEAVPPNTEQDTAPVDAQSPIEPAAIAFELGLERASASDFDRIRRSFAFANHPDRVAPHLRQRAMVRMQVANMLIDDAKSRTPRSGR